MLDQIVAQKRLELEERRQAVPLDRLRMQAPLEPPPALSVALRRPEINVIAEIKYASPSHGQFRCREEPERIAAMYVENGAAALSILTDQTFFRGSPDYLLRVASMYSRTPLLRKDFIVDTYQVVEARVLGASAFLLIAASLSTTQLRDLRLVGREHLLEALVEVHDPHELESAVESGARLIGVNNRNLRTFKVDLGTSFDLARRLEGEEGFVLVSESGIYERTQIEELRSAGYSAFLVGSRLMDSDHPGRALARLMGEVPQ